MTGRATDLERLAALARNAGLSSLADEAERVAERVLEGRFYVTCVGQFKRGKSTLLNALIGEPLLPAGVVPVTSVVTALRYGAERRARVRYESGAWEAVPLDTLAAYVSEEQNPENRKGVQAVEVFLPSRLLESGMCLVDTPGVGSVFAGASEATRAFVPHIDAALVVLGADPPISGEELSLVKAVAEQVDTLIFVLSKADRLSAGEREEAARFAERVLEQRLGRQIDRILEVSAAERLAGSGPKRDWDALIAKLTQLAGASGAGLVRIVEERARKHLRDRLRRGIDDQLLALRSPIEETEQRLRQIRESTSRIEQSLHDLHYLLVGEQQRLTRRLIQDRDQFLAAALTAASRELEEAIEAAATTPRGSVRRSAMDLARDVARRHLDRWLEGELPRAEAEYRDAVRRFVDLANDFVASLEAARDLGLEQLPPLFARETGFRTAGRLHYTELLRFETGSWSAAALDRLRSPRGAMKAALRDAREYLARLLDTNSARVQNDLIERVVQSRERLEADLRASLTEAADVTHRALERAREHRAAGVEAVRVACERLESLRAEVDALDDRAA